MKGQTRERILCIIGPTASGKSARAIDIALRGFVNPSFDEGFTKPLMGEVISVDSRQVYCGLDIGTEKISHEEMRGVPHHLIDIREVKDEYSAGDFVTDATRLIADISSRGKLPILVGGTHFYFDALLKGLPASVDKNMILRERLEQLSTEELYARVCALDARRGGELDPQNRRRLIRALEIIESRGRVVERPAAPAPYDVTWIVTRPTDAELRSRIETRLTSALTRGLVAEVASVREAVSLPGQGDARLNELGLEYKIVGEFLRGERDEPSLLPALTAKLWQYARRQRAWLRKLQTEHGEFPTSAAS